MSGLAVSTISTMPLVAHKANHSGGNLPLTFLPNIVLAVPIPFALLPGFTAPLAFPLFLFQAWVYVKVQLATGGRKGAGRPAKSGYG